MLDVFDCLNEIDNLFSFKMISTLKFNERCVNSVRKLCIEYLSVSSKNNVDGPIKKLIKVFEDVLQCPYFVFSLTNNFDNGNGGEISEMKGIKMMNDQFGIAFKYTTNEDYDTEMKVDLNRNKSVNLSERDEFESDDLELKEEKKHEILEKEEQTHLNKNANTPKTMKNRPIFILLLPLAIARIVASV